MKRIKSVVSLLLILLLLVACAAKTPTDFLTLASSKAKQIKSYAFEANIALSAKDAGDSSLESQGVFTKVNGLKATVKGAYDLEKERMEAIITFAISGDMTFSIDLPILTDKQLIYIKIPNTAPLFELPEEYVGKYIFLDLEQLTDDSLGIDLKESTELEAALLEDMTKMIINQYGQSEFLSILEKENLPKDKDVTQALQFKLTDTNLKPFMEKFLTETLPQMLEIIKANEDYLKQMDMTAAEIDTFLDEQLSTVDADEFINELANVATINEISYTAGLNKSDFINYQSYVIDFLTKSEGYRDEHVSITIDSHLTKINEEQSFELEIPSPSNIIDIMDLASSPDLFSSIYPMDDYSYDEGFESDYNLDDWDLEFSEEDFVSSYEYVDVTPNTLDFESYYEDGTFMDESGNWISKEEYLKLYGDNQLMYDELFDLYYDDFWNTLVPIQ